MYEDVPLVPLFFSAGKAYTDDITIDPPCCNIDI